MGLGYTLSEEVHFKGGEVLERSFGTLRAAAVLVAADDRGGGRSTRPRSRRRAAASRRSCRSGAAVANAIFDAVGARLDRMPMTPERVKAAMKR